MLCRTLDILRIIVTRQVLAEAEARAKYGRRGIECEPLARLQLCHVHEMVDNVTCLA